LEELNKQIEEAGKERKKARTKKWGDIKSYFDKQREVQQQVLSLIEWTKEQLTETKQQEKELMNDIREYLVLKKAKLQ
jgi:hypothetical protein